MKRSLLALLALMLVTGCASSDVEEEPEEEVEVVEEVVEEETGLSDVYTEPFYTVSGSSDAVLTDLSTEGAVILDFELADGVASVTVYNEDDEQDFPFIVYGEYSGSALLAIDGDLIIEISASSEWTLSARNASYQSTDVTEGSGDQVTPVFICTSDIYHITASTESEYGVFSVFVYLEDGTWDMLVLSSDTTYEGDVYMRNATGQKAFFEISGNNYTYSITPVVDQ